MSESITIAGIITKPEHDPYADISGVASKTYLKLDPRGRTVYVEQEFQDNAAPMDEWRQLIWTWYVPSYPRKEDMRQWIEDNISLFERICDGFERYWNGSNYVGRYSEDAHAAIAEIERMLDGNEGPDNYYEYWPVEEWIAHFRNQITADMTDEQLEKLAEELKEETDGVIIGGNVLRSITKIRDELREEMEDEEEAPYTEAEIAELKHRARVRVATTSALQPYADLFLNVEPGRDAGGYHWDWVATADLEVLLMWAKNQRQ